uniref:Uncharacterized protein n=1 Tax=Rhizophora mucronata TaxID=61149 RepID=A0A2P2QKE4_RHIMU
MLHFHILNKITLDVIFSYTHYLGGRIWLTKGATISLHFTDLVLYFCNFSSC